MGDETKSVFSSESLENALSDKDLRISYNVPESEAAKFISEKTTGMFLPDQMNSPTDVGLNVGLGIKRKIENANSNKIKSPFESESKKPRKPKTLSEKRERLEEEIMKYGLAEVEKMYPRQAPRVALLPVKKSKNSRASHVKMRPKPYGLDFKEIDVNKILRPFSHSKYIHEPDHNSVVFINRRKGIVPLSSLMKDSKTMFSSDAKILVDRNVSLGRPCIFLKDYGRMIAVGGSRDRQKQSLRVVTVPNIKCKSAKSSLDFIPFVMDEEFVTFAAEAVHIPKRKPKIDIRKIKKMRREKEEGERALDKILKEKSIIDHVFEKITADKIEDGGTKSDINKMETGETSAIELVNEMIVCADEDDEENKENIAKKPESDANEIFDKWTDETRSFINPLPDPEGKPVTTPEFSIELEARNSKLLAGYENCDVDDCFCRDSSLVTEIPTPVTDGTRTPNTKQFDEGCKKNQHVFKNLKKVKRALKTLGVRLIEFDNQSGDSKKKDCEKDYCRLGCICETIKGKNPFLPTHCGKLECMFRCFCSEESLKKFSSARKVGISPAGFANLQDHSQRNLSAEERKFHNTVVTTGGRDLIVISGRQKRERKVPTRYQDSDSLLCGDSSGRDFISSNKTLENSYKESILLPGQTHPTILRLMSDGLRERTTRKCTVLLPKINLPETLRVWCMVHCQYSCPCFKFENPLDYGPDRSKSRNVAKRSKSSGKKFRLTPSPVGGTPYKVQREHCARTEGIKVKQSKKLKIPHKFVDKKEMTSKVNGDVISVNLPGEEKTTIIDLSLKPKDTVQYLSWKILHYIYKKNVVKLWFFTRSGKPIFFVTRYSSPPYVRSSVNVKDLVQHTTDLDLLPAFARELISTSDHTSLSRKYAILTSNGLAWEITGILQKKGSATNGKEDKKSALLPPPALNQPCVVDLDLPMQKLQIGQNFVTIMKSSKVKMQIKLPQTTKSQYWCTLCVLNDIGSIQCPDSSLSLKAAVLKQAADLSTAENTTVRIPIPVAGEVPSFGVYAVPGLQNHVFIGPFSVKHLNENNSSSSDPEVICLDDDEDDDDITIIPANNPTESETPSSSGCRRKQRLHTKLDEIDKINNEKLVNSLVLSIVDRAVKFGERRRKRRIYSRQPILGPVPNVVSNGESEDVEIIIEDNDEQSSVESERLKSIQRSCRRLPAYQNIPTSEFGNIVIGHIDTNKTQQVEIRLPNGEFFTAFKNFESEKIRFLHPTFPKHIVMCPSISDAKNWMFEYKGYLSSSTSKNETEKKVESVKKSDVDINLRTVSILDTRNEQIQLFYKLRKAIAPEYVGGNNFSRIQILNYAKHLIEELRAKIVNQENAKKELLTQRSKLFDEFTTNLKGLSTDMKKKFVLDLKEGLKKSKDTPPPVKKSTQNVPNLIPIATGTNEKTDCVENRVAPTGATPYSDVTGLSTTLKDGKIRRPMNAFMLWAKGRRSAFISAGFSGAEVSKMLASNWQKLTDEEKSKFYIEADHLKSLHMIQHPDYKFSPKSKKKRKALQTSVETPSGESSSSRDPLSSSSNTGIIEISLD